ncbi:MAG TPA: hypothetical protein VGM67_03895 [Gemmatimonadaceae bacterium]|jgi:hypothetical protein
MDESIDVPDLHRGTLPSSKEKNAVHREVTRLLDELAPERAPMRIERAPASIQQHRMPDRCILQAPDAAVTVSWYADAADDTRLGELQIVQWRGVVARRGVAQRAAPATILRQQVVHPIEQAMDGGRCWRADDGTLYDTQALTAHCLELLHSQIEAVAE